MGKASKILYTVGKVVNVFEIIMTAFALVMGILIAAFGDAVIPSTPAFNWMRMTYTGVGMIVGGAVALVISVVTLVLANNATRALENGRTENAPHIVMIVVGFFGDIFYLLGGIFGIVSENTEPNYYNG